LDISYAVPRGAFAEHIKSGWGVDVHGEAYSSPGSPLGLRGDIQWINDGSRHNDYPFYWGGYTLRESTNNQILSIMVGPQFAINGGPFRPYVNLQGGVSHFSTSSSFDAVDVVDGVDPYLPPGQTYASDWKLTYNGGAGAAIPLTRGDVEILLHGGASYYVNSETTYLTKGDVQRDPDTGQISITPRRSEAHYLTYHLGISISFANHRSEK
jgi:hypothetical protein